MLYQLSYLGTSSRGGLGAAVYSQAGGPCPPRFASGFAWRSHAISRGRSVSGIARRAKTGGRERGQSRSVPIESEPRLTFYLTRFLHANRCPLRSENALTTRKHANIPNRRLRLPPCGRGSRRNSTASGSGRHPGNVPNRKDGRHRWPACRRSGTALSLPCPGRHRLRLSWHSTSQSESETLRRRAG